jgi:hypothetical protein
MSTVERADEPAKQDEEKKCPDCPSVSNCQINKLTVSQLSHFLALIFAGAILIVRTAPDGDSGRGVLGIIFTVLYCLVVTFYFIGSWELEEKWFNGLAGLKGAWRYAEISVRVLILFAIITSVSIYSDIIQTGTLFPEAIYGTLFMLMSIFWLFLFWDTLVVWGDENGVAIVKHYFFFDVVGCSMSFALIMAPSSQITLQVVFIVIYIVFIGGFLLTQFRNHVKLKLSGGMR